MFLYYLWCRQNPSAQELCAFQQVEDNKVFGVPLTFNFMIPETVTIR